MKNIFLILFALISGNSFAQVPAMPMGAKVADSSKWTETGANISNKNTGNVGIGITPLNKLHIGAASVANTGGVRLPITSTSAAQTGQPIGVDANGDIVRLAAASFDATVSFSTVTPTTGGVVFTPNLPANTTVLYVSAVDGSQWTYNGTTYVTQPASADWKTAGNAGSVQTTNFVGTTDNVGLSFRTNNIIRQTISNTGDVGIGTTAPAQKLDVNGNINQSGAAGNVGSIQHLASQSSPFSGKTVFGTDNSGWKYAISKRAGATTTDLLTVQDDGNVGIGTTTPTSKLHVFGKSTTNAGSTVVIGDDIAPLTGVNRSKLVMGNTTGISEFIVGQSPTNNLLFSWGYNATPASSFGILETYGGNNPLVLQNNTVGRVGIGINAPTSKLTVNGSFSLPFTSTGAADLTVTAAMYTINANNTSGGITITLPTPVGITGRIYVVKRDQGSTANVNVTTTGGALVQNTAGAFVTTYNLASLGSYGQSAMLQSDGLNWHRIN